MNSEKRVLYVGIDESNHGRYPEFTVGVFTFVEDYIRPQQFPVKRDIGLYFQFRNDKRIDYRYLVLNSSQIKESKSKLKVLAPKIVLPYFDTLPILPDELWILLDGGNFNREDCGELKKGLEGRVGRILSRSFQNQKKKVRGHKENTFYKQPFIVGLADLLASNLYHKFTTEGLDFTKSDPKRVTY